MAEATLDAMILISTSYQALNRIGDESTDICNCAVVIIFAGFFIEANLSHIIEKMNKKKDYDKFLGEKSDGLIHKLAYFYSYHVAETPQKLDDAIVAGAKNYFQGIKEIQKFRNDLAHGRIDRSKANPDDAKRLRKSAKDIVYKLYEFARKSGCDIPRSVTYDVAIALENIPGIELSDTSSS